MKNTLFAGLAIAAALVYCSPAAVCQTLPQETRFRLVHDVLIVVPVKVNGLGPFDFLLDTGNDTTTIDSSLAGRLGLLSTGHRDQFTVAGQKTLQTSVLGSLSLGAVETIDLPVLIEGLGGLRQADPQIQGVVGEDFLSRYSYLIDYSSHYLRMESGNVLREGLRGQRLALAPRPDPAHDKMIVDADAHAINRTALRLEIDSGANILVLLNDASQRLQVRVKGISWERTLAGNAPVPYGPVRVIQLGTEQLHEVMSVSSSRKGRPACDGLLPTSLFRALYVNNRENFVVFNPRFGETAGK